MKIPGQSWKSFETISRVMVGYSSVLYSKCSHYLGLFSDVVFRKHANISTDSQHFFGRNSITVKSAAIEKDKVSGLCVYFGAATKRLGFFVLLGQQIPILFITQHSLFLEILVMVFV